MREALAEQQKQIALQQQKIEKLEQQLATKQDVSAETTNGAPRVMDAALRATNPDALASPAPNRSLGAQDKPKESPLSFKIGGADFTPGGFVDFENIFRTTNTGNVAATSFGAIPYSNTAQGHLTEYRATGQYSRFNIKTHAKYGENDITGYVEFDFNGNDAANVFVSANGHTDRLRVYWLDLKRGKWEFLGGQTWGLQTPNRVGVSPNPADLSLGYGEDSGTHVGLNYTRAAEFRVAYHFNDHFVWAAAIQNPQQFTGGEVTFPTAFSGGVSNLTVQFDNAATPGAPNVAPDFMTKMAYDNEFAGGRRYHLEGGGLMTTAKATVVPSGPSPQAFHSHSTVGGGLFGDVLVDLYKDTQGRNFRFVASGMWGYGVGRYLEGLGPQVVVLPVLVSGASCAAVGAVCDIATSGVHAGDAFVGFEFVPHPKAQFGLYYGGDYFQRNFFPDLTVAANPAGLRPNIGFGFPNVLGAGGVQVFGGSANTNNRAIQQGTFDWTQTFWKNPQYGAVILVTQFSYLTRAPWFVAAGAPKNAHLGMSYVSLRYVLP